MISRDFFYIPPQLRIEIGQPDRGVPVQDGLTARDDMWREQREAEAIRIWKTVVEAAQ